MAPGAGSAVTSTMPVLTEVVLSPFVAPTSFRASFLAPERLGLALAGRFRSVGLAAVGFAAFRRAGLERLRGLVRAADFPLRTVARFLR